MLVLKQGCQIHFHRRPRQPRGCLQRAEIILGLYKCNYSLTVKEVNYIQPFEGNQEAGMAPGKNGFDTPVLKDTATVTSDICVQST